MAAQQHTPEKEPAKVYFTKDISDEGLGRLS